MKQIGLQKGFIGIITIMTITAALSSVIVLMSIEIFQLRDNVLISKRRKVSYNLAYSCLQIAALRASIDRRYAGNKEIILENAICSIHITDRDIEPVLFTAKAPYENLTIALEANFSMGSSTLSAIRQAKP